MALTADIPESLSEAGDGTDPASFFTSEEAASLPLLQPELEGQDRAELGLSWAIVGRFERGVMIEGRVRRVRLAGVSFHEGLAVPEFQEEQEETLTRVYHPAPNLRSDLERFQAQSAWHRIQFEDAAVPRNPEVE